MAWLSGWSYAKDISLTGQTGSGTLYQVELDIGASAGGDFHLENHCTNFPQDIEVTDNDGTTLLDFKIEDLTADPLKMWVEVADDLGSNQTIRVYYGKSGATTNSDGPATFPEFHDDFADGNYTGWTITEEIGDTVSASTYELIMVKGGTSGNCLTVRDSTSQLSTKHNWEFLVEYDSGKRINLILNGDNNNPAQGAVYLAFDSNGIRYYDTGYHTICAMSADTKYRCVVVPDVATNDFDIYVYLYSTGNEVTYSGAHTGLNFRNNATYMNQYRWNMYTANSDSGAFDNVLIRKYNSPEPAFSSAGAEQSAPVVGAIMNQFQKANMGADLYNGAIIA